MYNEKRGSIMEYIKICIYAILPMAIIFFIINNIIPTKNYARRTLVLFLVLIGFVIFFGGGALYDYFKFGVNQFSHFVYYLASGSMILIIIGFIIYNFVQTIRYHHHLAKDNKKFDKDLIQYLYIVYRYGGMYYVRKENKNGNILYLGDCSVFPKSCYFYDEAFTKYIDHLGINVKDYSYIGTATSNQKKKMIFYCFLVDLENDDNLEEFERISPYEIASLEMLDLHKTLVMRILIGESFNIEL